METKSREAIRVSIQVDPFRQSNRRIQSLRDEAEDLTRVSGDLAMFLLEPAATPAINR